MFLIFMGSQEVRDASNPRNIFRVKIPAGCYEVESITNPLGHAAPWWVLKGTKIGAAQGYLSSWQDPKYLDFQIIVSEKPIEFIVRTKTPGHLPNGVEFKNNTFFALTTEEIDLVTFLLNYPHGGSELVNAAQVAKHVQEMLDTTGTQIEALLASTREWEHLKTSKLLEGMYTHFQPQSYSVARRIENCQAALLEVQSLLRLQ